MLPQDIRKVSAEHFEVTRKKLLFRVIDVTVRPDGSRLYRNKHGDVIGMGPARPPGREEREEEPF